MRWKYQAISKLTREEKIKIKSIAKRLPEKGRGTFIPKKLVTRVGTAIKIVTKVRRWIVTFILLEIIDAYVSIVPLKMLL